MNTNIGSLNFACWTFLEDYTDTFARNFVNCSREVISGALPEKNLLLIGTELFKILFMTADNDSHHKDVCTVFKKIIKSTDKAYTILSRTWLIMAKDVIDCLIKRNGELNHLEMFLNRINELSELLTDVYFEQSRLPVVQKSNIDLNSREYREIVGIFSKYLQKADTDDEENELKIHTYYRSIPVELNATVRHVDDTSVTFNVHPYEAVALSSMGMALIKSSLHLGVFRAYAQLVDIQGRTATFTHFEQHDHPVERRAYIRIEPKGVIKAKIFISDDVIIGRISDISEVAVAIYARNIDTEPIVPGTIVNFTAELPTLYDKDAISLNTKGSISKIYHHTKGDADAHRIIIHWDVDPNLKSKLAQYISQRQVGIMRELKELSDDIE